MASKAGRLHLTDIKKGNWYWSAVFCHGKISIYRCQVDKIRDHRSRFKRPGLIRLSTNTAKIIDMYGYEYVFNGNDVCLKDTTRRMNSIYTELELGLFDDGYSTNNKVRRLNQVRRVTEPGVFEALFKSRKKLVSFLKMVTQFSPASLPVDFSFKPADADRDYLNIWTGQTDPLPRGLENAKPMQPVGEMPRELKDYVDPSLETDGRLEAAQQLAGEILK